MKVKLALERRDGAPVDIVVTTDSTALVGDVAECIAATDPFAEPARGTTPDGAAATPAAGAPHAGRRVTLSVAPPGRSALVALDPDAPISDVPIGSGFTAAVTEAGEVPGARGGADVVAIVRVVPPGGSRTREYPIGLGQTVLGRDPSAGIVLNDPMVSKRHARIDLTDDGAVLVDLNSANGIMVDGGLVPRVRVESGRPVLLGDSMVSVVLTEHSDAGAERVLERGGSLHFNRSPRVEVRYPGRSFPRPEVPSETEPQVFPWIALAAPLLMGVVMFALTRNALSLGFIALSPLMLAGNFLGQRSGVARKLSMARSKFDLQLDDLAAKFDDEQPKERAARLAESPSVAEIYEDALRLGPTLWTRRPEHWNFLDVRLGIGAVPSRNSVKDLGSAQGIPELAAHIDDLIAGVETLDGVPVVENIDLSGAVGIAGGAVEVADAARALLVQYVGLHSPAEVAMAALTGPVSTREFEWLKWLPHAASPQSPLGGVHLGNSTSSATTMLNAIEELILSRVADADRIARGASDDEHAASARGAKVGAGELRGRAGAASALVVVVADDAPVDRARLIQVLERAAEAAVYPIWLAPRVEALPATCRTYLDVGAGLDSAVVGFVRQGMTVDRVRVEGVSRDFALVLARRLAPVVDASAVTADSSDLPRSVSLLGLVGTDLAEDPGAVIDRWTQTKSISDRTGAPPVARKRAGNLRAIVGQASPDALHLDLRTQGPHALVGGTTGSGKSEFLQAWVLGMSAEYSPDRVTFLFVDYKGGSAFAECVSLPHCVGLVTDLSPHLVRRALTSLRAELHHREHLLNRKKAKDLLDLEKRGDPESPPALVIVIDEFAALASEVPEFVDGVVDIAQRGRSLGIHLIMATQRPAGVIKDNLRANTNLRVALRMADENDSTDVVGDAVAGRFDPAIPGRAIAKTGPGRLIEFQSGYAGGWTSDEPQEAAVSVSELRFGSEVVWEREEIGDPDVEESDLGANDQVRLVRTLVAAAAAAGIPAPRRPWLDELPAVVDLASTPTASDAEIPIGLVDLPDRQRQQPAYFLPDRDGHMAVFGTSGSGKSLLLRTLGIAAGLGSAGGPVHVYGLDFATGALRMLEALPHVGSVVSGDDFERVTRLLRDLRDRLDDRARRFSEVDAADIVQYRLLANRPDEPRILLLLDGFPSFRDEYDTGIGRTAYYNILIQILNEGRPLGVHVVFSADRSTSVPSAVSSNIQRRIVLRLADEGGYLMLGAPKDILDTDSAPGRAIIDGNEAQISVVGGSTNVAEQAKAVQRLAETVSALGRPAAPIVGSLPREVELAELPIGCDGRPTLGIGDVTLGPVGFEPTGTFLVAGPPASGKTTALVSLAQTVARWRPDSRLFLFGTRRSSIQDALPWLERALTPDAGAELAAQLLELVADEEITAKLVVVVDTITEFQGSAAETALTELIKAINRSDHLLLTDGDVSSMSSGWGLVAEAKASRRGIVLMPDTFDGDAVFKVPFPRITRSESPPGRGLQVAGATVTKVQLPLPLTAGR